MSPGLALLSFSLQPSRWMHASHWADTAPPGLDPASPVLQRVLAWPQGHRAWSQWLWQTHKLSPVDDWAEPALRWALLPEDALAQVVERAGLVLLNRRIRHTISATQVRELNRVFVADAVRFARLQAPQWHPGLTDLPDQPIPEWPVLVQALGWALLRQVAQGAAPTLRSRLLWRLPKPGAVPGPDDLILSITLAQAQALVFSLIDLVLPAWLSSFPRPQAH